MVRAIELINSSSMGPGPLGILPTNPTASAPASIASRASSCEAMQHILILILIETLFANRHSSIRILAIGMARNSPRQMSIFVSAIYYLLENY
jgi:hypothetical protein